MTRKEARALLGDQPKWALRNMARALQMLTRSNNVGDWRRLEALRALGYKVTCDIPAMGRACAVEFERIYPRVIIGKPGAAYAGEK